MEATIILLVLGTSIWVLFDAKVIGLKKGQANGFTDMGPWGWFFACLLLWIVCFPLYLSKRSERWPDIFMTAECLYDSLLKNQFVYYFLLFSGDTLLHVYYFVMDSDDL